MKAINVKVEDEVYDALWALSQENRRNMKQQLATLIIQAWDERNQKNGEAREAQEATG